MQKFSTMNGARFFVWLPAACQTDCIIRRVRWVVRKSFIRGSGEGDVTVRVRRPYVADGQRLVRIGSIVGRVPVRRDFVHRQRMGFLAASPAEILGRETHALPEMQWSAPLQVRQREGGSVPAVGGAQQSK
jgi:hypothetical protein